MTYEEQRIQFLRDGTHELNSEADGNIVFFCRTNFSCSECKIAHFSLHQACHFSARYDKDILISLLKKEMPEVLL